MKKLTVVARIEARPEHQETIKQHLLDLIPPTLLEDGCLQYDLHQSRENPAEFLFYENWTGRAELDAHLQTEHLKNFAEKSRGLLARPVEIRFYEPLETGVRS